MSNQWQDKTRGGYPVENVRPYGIGIWEWTGEVTHPDGSKLDLTWTDEGYHRSDRQPRDSDLVPLEAPAETPVEPDPRKALAMAAKAYKSACDVMDLAMEEEKQSLDAFMDLRKACGLDDIVVAIGDQHFLFFTTDDEILISEIEVL